RHVHARHRLGFAANDGMNDEVRGEVATGGGHDRAPDRELAVQADAVLELLAAQDFEAAQGGCGRVESSCGGADDGISGERPEIVHDYANHLLVISRERRYIAVASSGRFNRSSTLPMPYSALGLAGRRSTARSYAASSSARAPSRSPRASRINARLLRAFTCWGSRAKRSRYDAAARSISPRSVASLAATYRGSSDAGAGSGGAAAAGGGDGGAGGGAGGSGSPSSSFAVMSVGPGFATGSATRSGGGWPSRATSRGEAIAPVWVRVSASSISSAATRARSCDVCQRRSRRGPRPSRFMSGPWRLWSSGMLT